MTDRALRNTPRDATPPEAVAHHLDGRGEFLSAGPEVTDAAGHAYLWAVTAMSVRDKNDFPVLSMGGPHRLVLVTCGGPVNRINGAWHFQDNVIVTAVPA
jgi:hypothetical protein